jgi:hypothetical protein
MRSSSFLQARSQYLLFRTVKQQSTVSVTAHQLLHMQVKGYRLSPGNLPKVHRWHALGLSGQHAVAVAALCACLAAVLL